MARQGRLHSAPFHVENSRYKYAVEHETSDYIPQQVRVTCECLNSKKCTLWNSGFSSCLEFKCRKLNKGMARDASCDACAFCYGGHCYHTMFPKGKNSKVEAEAHYCCYFTSMADNKARFEFIRNRCERIAYTRMIGDLKKRETGKRKYIEKARHEIDSMRCNSRDIDVQLKSIAAKEAEVAEIRREANAAIEHLNLIGGELHRLDEKEPRPTSGAGRKR